MQALWLSQKAFGAQRRDYFAGCCRCRAVSLATPLVFRVSPHGRRSKESGRASVLVCCASRCQLFARTALNRPPTKRPTLCVPSSASWTSNFGLPGSTEYAKTPGAPVNTLLRGTPGWRRARATFPSRTRAVSEAGSVATRSDADVRPGKQASPEATTGGGSARPRALSCMGEGYHPPERCTRVRRVRSHAAVLDVAAGGPGWRASDGPGATRLPEGDARPCDDVSYHSMAAKRAQRHSTA